MILELIPVMKIGYNNQTSYLAGTLFYRLFDINDSDLTKLVIEYTKQILDGEYTREESCTFSGGYVLRVDGENKYFPQCCGELSDIAYWKKISNQKHSYYEGHPTPQIKFIGNKIVFDFSVDDFGENFQPTPPETILTVDKFDLKNAVEKAEIELKEFEKRLEKINWQENLNIEDIGGLLIWRNANYE